jgi:hypothetical protein
MPKSQTPENLASHIEWQQFSDSLLGFIEKSNELTDADEFLRKAREVHSKCPSDTTAINQTTTVQSLIPYDLSKDLITIVKRSIEAKDEILALFFMGICSDATDSLLEALLDLVDEGMNLSTLATCFIPHNIFEVNALVSLAYWPDFSDWARAHLVVRGDIGLANQDRDGLIEYLGHSSIIGSDTLLAVSHDICEDPSKYSAASVEALKAFLVSDFDAVSDFNGSSLDDLENHFIEIGDYWIGECSKALGIS